MTTRLRERPAARALQLTPRQRRERVWRQLRAGKPVSDAELAWALGLTRSRPPRVPVWRIALRRRGQPA